MTQPSIKHTGAPRLVDLDPADLTARVNLRDQLAALRTAHRYTVAEFAALLGVDKANHNRSEIEPTPNQRLDAVTPLANALGHSFTLRPIGVEPYADTPIAEILELLGGDDFQHEAVVERLITARRLRFSGVEFAGRLGISVSALKKMEASGGDRARISTWQRYTRASGGHLELVLTPFPEGGAEA